MDVANYLLKYGLGGVIVAVIVVIVTGLLKSPLKKVAVAKAEEKGVDKEVFTRWLALIPLFLAFVGAVVNVSACNGWANPFLEGFDWKTTAVEAAAAWGVAVAFYENGSLFLKSLKSGKMSTSSSGSATTAKSSVAGTSKSVVKAKAKVESLSSQLAKAQETLINEEAEEKRKADAVAKAKAEAEAAAQKAAAEAEAARLKAEQEAKAKEIAAKKAQLESLEKQREGLLKEINGSNTETIN